MISKPVITLYIYIYTTEMKYEIWNTTEDILKRQKCMDNFFGISMVFCH